ncbi:hypothetical protein RAM80_26115 [Pseudomonas sp. App30]|uniref:hypothetical protein n=1 Tax=Pseudomonas sp. App30 TaxID=3068990 RepID=UPI003A7FBE17
MKVKNQDNLHAWMSNNAVIGNLRIDQLILPGSHDSGSHKRQRPQLQLPHEITQDLPPIEQVRNGIRSLDLRVRFCRQFAAGDPRRFQLTHMNSVGRSLEEDLITPLLAYYDEADTQREIIILDLHQLKDFTPAAHEELQQVLAARLGHRCLPYDAIGKKLVYLWLENPGKTLVLAYRGPAWNALIWKPVNQRWSESNTLPTHQLKNFMDKVAREHKPDEELRSIQCARYALPLFLPDDFSDKIDLWFHSEDEQSYIQQFYIINTDWSLRSRIVANCIHASVVKALSR